MPDAPTSGVNGHVSSSAALQASMSMLSLAPAATTFGWFASIATVGSFCLFCENGLGGLPEETSVSPPVAAATATIARAASTTAARPQKPFLIWTSHVRESGPPTVHPPAPGANSPAAGVED